MGERTNATMFPTELTAERALVVARWLTLLWMVGVVAVSSERNAIEHLLAAWLCIVAVASVSVWSTYAVRAHPETLMARGFVAVEVGLAIGLSIIDGWVFEPGYVFEVSQSLATPYPLIVVVSVGIARGPVVAATVGMLIGPAEWLGAVLDGFDEWSARHVIAIVATSLFYAATGAVFGWQARLLHRAEADRQLRRIVFGADGCDSDSDDFEQRVRAAVDRAARHPDAADVALSVGVLDNDRAAPPDVQDAIAAAIGEAVANALEHAGASQIVVFVDVDDDATVFASVRDDGQGFDVDAAPPGHGLDESIVGRVRDIGGRSEIVSSPGRTEVRLWSS